MAIKDLLTKSIYWQKHSSEVKYFYAYSDNQPLLLRLNNFPDEPLLTVIAGLEIMNLEDTPEFWVVPFS